MHLERYRNRFIIVYVVVVVVLYIFVRSALNDTSIQISDKEPIQKAEHIEEYNVKLSVPYLNKEYTIKLNSTDTVLDLLETLRRDDTSYFYYEKTLYTYGLELCCINDTNLSWKLKFNNEDITKNIDDIYLQNDGVYILEPDFTRTSELQ
ncbi:MAG: hypothetical protein WC243_02110 [Patescibacteria group bacterium]|jgi:hypothetical protein